MMGSTPHPPTSTCAATTTNSAKWRALSALSRSQSLPLLPVLLLRLPAGVASALLLLSPLPHILTHITKLFNFCHLRVFISFAAAFHLLLVCWSQKEGGTSCVRCTLAGSDAQLLAVKWEKWQLEVNWMNDKHKGEFRTGVGQIWRLNHISIYMYVHKVLWYIYITCLSLTNFLRYVYLQISLAIKGQL